jgi:Putative Actinobacterial Holin-X, holin superfamily III
MKAPGVDQASERPLQQLAETVSEQALVMARQQVQLARRELTAIAGQAGPGAGMLGGAALLGMLASGTGTAALVLLLAGRRGPSAAALGVTGAYAGAGALLAREGFVRLREAGPLVPDDAGQNARKTPRSAKRSERPAAKPAERSTPRSRGSTKTEPGAPRRQSDRMRRRRASEGTS